MQIFRMRNIFYACLSNVNMRVVKIVEKIHEIRMLIKTINHYFYDLLTYEIKGMDLTAPQVLVLRCISDQPLMMSSISEKVLLSNSTVSGIIDRLVKNGYVKRTRDTKDRRIVWVTETEKLNKLRGKLPVLDKNFSAILFEDLESSKIEQIKHSLQLLSVHMQQNLENYKNSKSVSKNN